MKNAEPKSKRLVINGILVFRENFTINWRLAIDRRFNICFQNFHHLLEPDRSFEGSYLRRKRTVLRGNCGRPDAEPYELQLWIDDAVAQLNDREVERGRN